MCRLIILLLLWLPTEDVWRSEHAPKPSLEMCQALKGVLLEKRMIFPSEAVQPEHFWKLIASRKMVPSLAEADVFPYSIDYVHSCREFNFGYQRTLKRKLPFATGNQREFIQEALEETQLLGNVYDAAYEAKFPWNSDRTIIGLVNLRRLLGDEAYFSGQLPDCVPLHYFELDLNSHFWVTSK